MKEVTWLMAIDDDLAEGFLQHNQLTEKIRDPQGCDRLSEVISHGLLLITY
jgi:hypothetical protein